MVHIVTCILFGEVLMDENQNFILLCSNCHKDFTTLNAFRKHFFECKGAEQLMEKNAVLNFVNNERLYESKMSRTEGNELKQFRIYRINTVNVIQKIKPVEADNGISTLDLETELSDPRWYTVSEKSVPVNSTSIIATSNSDANIKQQPFKENLKTYKDVNTKTKPDAPICEVTLWLNRIERSHDYKGQQQQQRNETQSSLLVNRQMPTTVNTESLLKGSIIPPVVKASPDLQIRRNKPRLVRSINNKAPNNITTNNNSKEKIQQNQAKLIKQQTVATTANTKRLLNGSTSCVAKVETVSQIVTVNPRLTRSMNNNNNSNPKKQDETQQHSLLVNSEASIPKTDTTKTLFKGTSSISCSAIKTSSPKKPKLSEPADYPEVPLVKGISLSKPTKPATISVIKVNPPCNAVNQNVKASHNVAARTQVTVTGSHKTKETLNNQIPTQTKETEQILNKLQNLGVAIKRTSVAPTQAAGISTNDSKALKIIQKLQSNGIKVVTMKPPPPPPAELGGGQKL